MDSRSPVLQRRADSGASGQVGWRLSDIDIVQLPATGSGAVPWCKGAKRYKEYRDKQVADPRFRAIYEEEAAKEELWLQLVEARQAAGLTQSELAKRLGVSQARVARLQKRGFEDYTLNSLRRYVEALGGEFRLEVKVRRCKEDKGRDLARVAMSH